MKLKFMLLFTPFILGLLISCKDDSIPELTKDDSWNLKNVHGGFAGINIDYTVGDVIWTFHEDTKTLVIENDILSTGPEDIYAGRDSGSYKYEIRQEDDSQVLYIEGNKRGELSIENNVMKIDDGLAADGFLTVFEK